MESSACAEAKSRNDYGAALDQAEVSLDSNPSEKMCVVLLAPIEHALTNVVSTALASACGFPATAPVPSKINESAK
jgi:hypothetical protein